MRTLKISTATFAFLLFSLTAFSQALMTDLQKENLIGKIKSMTETRKSRYEDEKYEYQYNEKGNLVSQNYYFKGKFRTKTQYTYDTRGFLTAMKAVDSSGKLVEKENYINDAKGNVLQVTHTDYEYNSAEIKTYKRDLKGYVTEYSEKDAKTGKIREKTTYNRDAKGTVIFEYKNLANKDYIKTNYKPKYNARGLLEELEEVSESDMSEDGRPSISTTAYLYNGKDIVIYEVLKTKNGMRVTTSDDKGNTVKTEDSFGYKPTMESNQYAFDTVGNWTKRTITRNGEIYEITERVITYY
jgi:hypothetical protein